VDRVRRVLARPGRMRAMTSSNRRLAIPRWLIVVGAIAVTIVILVGMVTREPKPLPAPVEPMLPDLAMAPIEEVKGGLLEGTLEPVVRVEGTIMNIGTGDFRLSIRRSLPWTTDWTVYQRIEEAGGGYTERETPAELTFVADPHDHWHVQDMEAHRLEDLETGEVINEVIKQGYCMFDSDLYFGELPGAPAEPVFLETACGVSPITTAMSTGVSIGWGDKYPWHMMEQAITLAGIPDGTYRIREIADPFDMIEESDETNNETWIVVELTDTDAIPKVRIVDRADPVTPSVP